MSDEPQAVNGRALVLPDLDQLSASASTSAGRDAGGRFVSGERLPAASVSLAASVRRWRAKLLATVHEGDVEAVYRELLSAALDRAGPRRDQLAACRLLLEYIAGKPEAVADVEPGPGGRGGFVFKFTGPVQLLAAGVDQVGDLQAGDLDQGSEPGPDAEPVAGDLGDQARS